MTVRKSDKVHQLHGTHREDRHGDPDSKMVFEDELDCIPPDWLGAFGQYEWMRVTNLFKGSEILMENSRSIMECYCILYQDIRTIQKDGGTVPAAMHANIRAYLAKLGLSPTDSDKLVRPKHDKSKSRFVLDD